MKGIVSRAIDSLRKKKVNIEKSAVSNSAEFMRYNNSHFVEVLENITTKNQISEAKSNKNNCSKEVKENLFLEFLQRFSSFAVDRCGCTNPNKRIQLKKSIWHSTIGLNLDDFLKKTKIDVNILQIISIMECPVIIPDKKMAIKPLETSPQKIINSSKRLRFFFSIPETPTCRSCSKRNRCTRFLKVTYGEPDLSDLCRVLVGMHTLCKTKMKYPDEYDLLISNEEFTAANLILDKLHDYMIPYKEYTLASLPEATKREEIKSLREKLKAKIMFKRRKAQAKFFNIPEWMRKSFELSPSNTLTKRQKIKLKRLKLSQDAPFENAKEDETFLWIHEKEEGLGVYGEKLEEENNKSVENNRTDNEIEIENKAKLQLNQIKAKINDDAIESNANNSFTKVELLDKSPEKKKRFEYKQISNNQRRDIVQFNYLYNNYVKGVRLEHGKRMIVDLDTYCSNQDEIISKKNEIDEEICQFISKNSEEDIKKSEEAFDFVLPSEKGGYTIVDLMNSETYKNFPKKITDFVSISPHGLQGIHYYKTSANKIAKENKIFVNQLWKDSEKLTDLSFLYKVPFCDKPATQTSSGSLTPSKITYRDGEKFYIYKKPPDRHNIENKNSVDEYVRIYFKSNDSNLSEKEEPDEHSQVKNKKGKVELQENSKIQAIVKNSSNERDICFENTSEKHVNKQSEMNEQEDFDEQITLKAALDETAKKNSCFVNNTLSIKEDFLSKPSDAPPDEKLILQQLNETKRYSRSRLSSNQRKTLRKINEDSDDEDLRFGHWQELQNKKEAKKENENENFVVDEENEEEAHNKSEKKKLKVISSHFVSPVPFSKTAFNNDKIIEDENFEFQMDDSPNMLAKVNNFNKKVVKLIDEADVCTGDVGEQTTLNKVQVGENLFVNFKKKEENSEDFYDNFRLAPLEEGGSLQGLKFEEVEDERQNMSGKISAWQQNEEYLISRNVIFPKFTDLNKNAYGPSEAKKINDLKKKDKSKALNTQNLVTQRMLRTKLQQAYIPDLEKYIKKSKADNNEQKEQHGEFSNKRKKSFSKAKKKNNRDENEEEYEKKYGVVKDFEKIDKFIDLGSVPTNPEDTLMQRSSKSLQKLINKQRKKEVKVKLKEEQLKNRKNPNADSSMLQQQTKNQKITGETPQDIIAKLFSDPFNS